MPRLNHYRKKSEGYVLEVGERGGVTPEDIESSPVS